jgi:hypothetical protein
MFVDNEFPKKNEKVCPMNYDDPWEKCCKN